MDIIERIKDKLHDQQARDRFQICEACDKFNKNKVKCQVCGCYLWAKVVFTKSKCPIGKW